MGTIIDREKIVQFDKGNVMRLKCVHGVVGLVALTVSGIGGCIATGPELEVVSDVQLDRYDGKWYEIAKYPVSFERGCSGVTAEYTIRDDGRVTVLNTCLEGSLDGPVRTIEGTARVVNAVEPAKLAVSFFGPFEAPYWVIDLDGESPDSEPYQWAVVGDPTRQFLWILSRTPQLDEDIYAGIIARLPDKGYDPARLEPMEQPVE
jgi:apolipoprotein D and lipocalin family protein